MATDTRLPITHPRSRHNIHVTARSDLRPVGDWSVETLYQAVKAAAAGDGHTVVLDYDRSKLYIAAAEELTYQPPEALGFESPPALDVAAPQLFDPDGPTLRSHASVRVGPEFDLLIPAFDWDELTEDDILPPTDRRPTRSPSGTGTPG